MRRKGSRRRKRRGRNNSSIILTSFKRQFSVFCFLFLVFGSEKFSGASYAPLIIGNGGQCPPYISVFGFLVYI